MSTAAENINLAQTAHKLATSVYEQAIPTPETDLALAQVFATLAHTEALTAATEAVERLQAYLELSGSSLAIVPTPPPPAGAQQQPTGITADRVTPGGIPTHLKPSGIVAVTEDGEHPWPN